MAKNKMVGKSRENVAKASKGMGKVMPKMKGKGNKAYCPKIQVIG